MKDLTKWQGCPEPNFAPTDGRFAVLEPARFPDDAEAVFAATGGRENDELWRYIPLGPFESAETLGATFAFITQAQNWQTLLIRDAKTRQVTGMASYMRIRATEGSAEVGCVVFSKALQRTAAATEAMYLMARHLFDDLGYRRFEWKCNNANAASRQAADRLGFQFEGVFRQDQVVKGENRDTAWFSMLDTEWPERKRAFEGWLDPDNFDPDGRQKRRLADFRDSD